MRIFDIENETFDQGGGESERKQIRVLPKLMTTMKEHVVVVFVSFLSVIVVLVFVCFCYSMVVVDYNYAHARFDKKFSMMIAAHYM